MWTLYGSKGSGSAAIEMALERCALPYQVQRASTWEPDSAQAELQKVNPLGQIPTLLDPGGEVLTESAAILIHLGLIFPQAGLLPVVSGPRAEHLRGLVYVAANCYSAIGIIDYPQRFSSDDSPAVLDAIRAGTRTQLHRCWNVFADQFGALICPEGGLPSALDLLADVVSRWGGARAHLQQARPALALALARIDEHPSVSPVAARHWPPERCR